MIARRFLTRTLAPTKGLRWPAITVLVGLVLFASGFALSFFQAIVPWVDRVGAGWTSSLEMWMNPTLAEQVNHVLGGAFLLAGAYLVFSGSQSALRRISSTLNPGLRSNEMVNTFVRRQRLATGPKIVALGGGTGLSTLLRGLKQHSSNITAIVTVSDDGGSSGRLSKEMGIIPPGDIRNCLVALADAEKLMTDLFQHRFKAARGTLGGHSLGNLLIAGLVEQCDGDFDQALTMASEVLNIRGRVVPSTLARVRLRAVMDDGSELCGETTIVEAGRRIRRMFLDPMEGAVAEAFPEAIAAIREADLIVVGPGSVYTSVIPNLLIPSVSEAIEASDAKKIYICNVMTQPGESDSFTAAEHVAAIMTSVDRKVFDYVLVNTGAPSEVTLEKYRNSDQFFVEPDVDRIRARGVRTISGNFMNELDFVRHDPLKLASRLMDLLDR
jgi:uncharacterized cofD-like protein